MTWLDNQWAYLKLGQQQEATATGEKPLNAPETDKIHFSFIDFSCQTLPHHQVAACRCCPSRQHDVSNCSILTKLVKTLRFVHFSVIDKRCRWSPPRLCSSWVLNLNESPLSFCSSCSSVEAIQKGGCMSRPRAEEIYRFLRYSCDSFLLSASKATKPS